MIISFSGAQSTGKSTLLEQLRQDDRFKKFAFEPEVTRLIKKRYGLNINEEGGDLTQLAILNAHLENYLKYRKSNVVLDRCILDGFVYSNYQMLVGSVNKSLRNYNHYLFMELKDKVDIIFYTEPDIPLVDDGERSINKVFRDQIVMLFELAIQHYGINVVRLKGTVEERMKIIYNTIDEYEAKHGQFTN